MVDSAVLYSEGVWIWQGLMLFTVLLHATALSNGGPLLTHFMLLLLHAAARGVVVVDSTYLHYQTCTRPEDLKQ
ncbi:hypothetical protein LOK49_LG15G01081 [Camellia lanceoleosa]|uniref:Uncharacterized protein n=1 Tax=Camellia lanceoleosa TaxID=1840588 RepID=A0ACC0F773_9ERIC|nr:hypothetical protein LOK49_LG15G01081 [Camellia lanceoleosa]